MTYELSDEETIRARVEKRLAPLKKLRRLRLWLFLNLGLFISFIFFSSSGGKSNPVFMQALEQAGQSFNPTTQTWEAATYVYYQPYPLVYAVLVVWFFLLVAHAIHVWSAYRHERAIRREMEREANLELERLRLQVELAKNSRRADEDDEEYTTEKVKRSARLGDDGELFSEEEPRAARRARS